MFATAFDAFAEIALWIVVAQFNGFVLAGGRAGWYGGAADCAISKMHVGFDSGIAAGVEDLAAHNFDDFHMVLFWVSARLVVQRGGNHQFR